MSKRRKKHVDRKNRLGKAQARRKAGRRKRRGSRFVDLNEVVSRHGGDAKAKGGAA